MLLALFNREFAMLRHFAAVVALLAPFASAQDLRIYHTDVEQADATLFVAPSGMTLAIDAGGSGPGDSIKAVREGN